MSHEPSSERKRKPVEDPGVAINSDGKSSKKSNKARRVALDASMTLSHIAPLQGNAPIATERVTTANNPSASNVNEQVVSIVGIREKIKNLSGSDDVEVNAALVALFMDLKKIVSTRDTFVAARGCRALVRLLKNGLHKAIDRISACDQVTELTNSWNWRVFTGHSNSSSN
jgi:hypothetical protein